MTVTYTPAITEVIEKLEAGNPLPTLVPQHAWSSELTDALESASLDDLFDGESLKNRTFGEAIKSGLLLWKRCPGRIPHDLTGTYGSDGQLLARYHAPPRARLSEC